MIKKKNISKIIIARVTSNFEKKYKIERMKIARENIRSLIVILSHISRDPSTQRYEKKLEEEHRHP